MCLQQIQKVNLFTSSLPQHLYRLNLISENHLLKEMIIFLLLWKPNWTLTFLFLSLWRMFKENHIGLTETEMEMGYLFIFKKTYQANLQQKLWKGQTQKQIYKIKKKEKSKSYKTHTNFCTELHKRRIKSIRKGFI